MQPLDLNMASRPFKNDTLPWAGLITAVVVLILVTVWNIRSYKTNAEWAESLQQQYAVDRQEMEQFDRRERGAQRDIEGFNLEALTVRADKANEVIRWKAFSWTQLFNLLQDVLPNDVQMVSIRPVFRPQGPQRGSRRPKEGRVPVSVEGMAKSLEALLELQNALYAHLHFDRVEPQGYTRDRTGTLAFQIDFLYDPTPASEMVEEVAQLELPDPEPQTGAGETVAATDPADRQAAESTGDGAEQPDVAAVPQRDAPPLGGDSAQDAEAVAEVAPPNAEGMKEPTPPAAGSEATTEEDPAAKAPGRRKSGKRRGGSGRATEGDR